MVSRRTISKLGFVWLFSIFDQNYNIGNEQRVSGAARYIESAMLVETPDGNTEVLVVLDVGLMMKPVEELV